jgi:hypothetical protein
MRRITVNTIDLTTGLFIPAEPAFRPSHLRVACAAPAVPGRACCLGTAPFCARLPAVVQRASCSAAVRSRRLAHRLLGYVLHGRRFTALLFACCCWRSARRSGQAVLVLRHCAGAATSDQHRGPTSSSRISRHKTDRPLTTLWTSGMSRC